LAREKATDWANPEYHLSDLKISTCTGDYRLTKERTQELDDADIIIMTSEMLSHRSRSHNSEQSQFLKKIGTLVIDEFHTIGVKNRGDHLEVGLMKFTQINPTARIVLLSATMPNVEQLAEWVSYSLNQKQTFVLRSEYRPVPLTTHYETYDDFIYHPIIRDDVINSKVCNKGHYTVYLPNFKLLNLVSRLMQFRGVQFHIFSSEVQNITKNRNCIILPLNKEEFLDSFISSEGIITTGGFQTTSESLYCGKKLLVIPIKGQYEQICNVEALKKIGVMCGDDLDSISLFLLTSNIIIKKWEDPTDKIINKIINGN
jgi:hypothetical protein